jgi:hypothetical protein
MPRRTKKGEIGNPGVGIAPKRLLERKLHVGQLDVNFGQPIEGFRSEVLIPEWPN